MYELEPDDWTLIASGETDDDIEIRALAGSFLVSLNQPDEKGAALLMVPPVSVSSQAWASREVVAGIRVYAKATEGPATASVRPLAK